MEPTGIEPVTSGLQTQPIARLNLTPTNKIGRIGVIGNLDG